jgi:hypothetical protein
MRKTCRSQVPIGTSKFQIRSSQAKNFSSKVLEKREIKKGLGVGGRSGKKFLLLHKNLAEVKASINQLSVLRNRFKQRF